MNLFSWHGLQINRLSQGKVLPLGYSNGMLGYIPTAQQILEGGYESKDSLYVFSYSSPFVLESEESIHRTIHELLSRFDLIATGAG